MQSKLYDLKCPKCNAQWVVKGESVLNDELEPKAFQYIIDRSFFARKCSHCHYVIEFTYPLIYHFPKEKYVVSLEHNELKISNMEVYEAASIEEFIEILLIVKAGLDITSIQLLKQRLIQYSNLYFESYENGHIFFDSNKGLIGVDASKINRIKR